MTPKEYLGQSYRLKERIDQLVGEIGNMRILAMSVKAAGYDAHYNATRPTEAAFEKTLERIDEYEIKLSERVSLLVELKKQIYSVISMVSDPDEQMVLNYRYIDNLTWEHIGDKLHADTHTVRRWHDRALAHVSVPDEPIII